MGQDTPPDSDIELFGTLERESTLANRVTEQIKGHIIAGDLRTGVRLPPERELARQFGVSRTVIREAVRALTAQGLLEVRAGSGSIVRNPSAASVAESMALFLGIGRPDFDYKKILEVRRLIEVEIAGLAAQRRTEEDIVTLETILAETVKVGESQDEWVRNDIAFHAHLALATKNELFSLLLDSITDTMVTVRRLGFSVPNAWARALKYHGAILEGVKQGDPERARQAMRAHLEEAESTMRQALEFQTPEQGNSEAE